MPNTKWQELLQSGSSHPLMGLLYGAPDHVDAFPGQWHCAASTAEGHLCCIVLTCHLDIDLHVDLV